MGRRGAVIAAVVLAACGLAACGGGATNSSGAGGVVARVGDATITEAALAHWTSVMAAKEPASAERALRQRALSFLISSRWQIGEAAEQGLAATSREVKQHLQSRIDSYKNGEAEFHEVLKVSGQTSADVTLEIEAELASAQLARRAKAVASPMGITQAEVASYYRKNKHAFSTPEGRQVEVFHTESVALARKVAMKGVTGRKLANVTDAESLVYVKGLKGNTKTVLSKRIFEARLGGFVGPVQVGPNYFVFELTSISPPTQSTLAEVRGTIEASLEAEARRTALAAVIKSWRTKWIAKTDCKAGFIVQKCRQYTASQASSVEPPLVFN
jgi:foldase protein PrsA